MEDTQKPYTKPYEWLKPYHFKKGNRANPGGRPKGAKSLKTFAKEYFERLPESEKVNFLNTVNRELVWRMAEGNPPQQLDGNPDKPLVQIIFDSALKPKDEPNRTAEDNSTKQ